MMGLAFAIGASVVIESFRLYVLYIIFGRELPKAKLTAAAAGYIALAALCFYANFLAINQKIQKIENQIISEMMADYQKISTAAIRSIRNDIKMIESDIRNDEDQNIQNRGLIKAGLRKEKITGIKEGRDQRINKYEAKIKVKLTEIEKLSSFQSKNMAKIKNAGLQVAAEYDISLSPDTFIIPGGESGSESILSDSQKAKKLIINLAIILIIEIGIMVTAMSAKANGKALSDFISSDKKNDKPVSEKEKVESEYQKIISSNFWPEWKTDRYKSDQVPPGEKREFAKRALKFFRKHPELLEILKEKQNDTNTKTTSLA